MKAYLRRLGETIVLLTKYDSSPLDLTFLCFLFCTGFIWGEIKEMWDGGFTEYVHDWWNLMDFAMNSLYLATISLKIVAYVKVRIFPCPQKIYLMLFVYVQT